MSASSFLPLRELPAVVSERLNTYTSDKTRSSRNIITCARRRYPRSFAYKDGEVFSEASGGLLSGPTDTASKITYENLVRMHWHRAMVDSKGAADDVKLTDQNMAVLKPVYIAHALAIIKKQVKNNLDLQDDLSRFPNLAKLISDAPPQ